MGTMGKQRVRGQSIFRLGVFALALAAAGQQPAGSGEHVIRITVNLVQVDAVVTDSKGKPVTDLEAKDFEILQDGKPQKIKSFSFVRVEGGVRARPVTADRNAPPVPPSPVKPSQIQRTIAVVVDDLGMSWESMAQARQALKKFIDERVQPGDLVAVVRTGAGMGALQSFTTDRRQLYAAVERVKWNPLGRGGVAAFGNEEDPGGGAIEDFRQQIFSVGTLGALNYVISGLRDLPGRKSVVLLSDGMKIFDRDGYSDRVKDALERLSDLANRAAVVIYTVDARGLPTLSIGASERVDGSNPTAVMDRQRDRSKEYFESQDGLHYLAHETGGLFFHDSNDIAGSLGKALEDQQGYYLLGYAPGEATFNKTFHKIQVKVKVAGLAVRSRTGFLGIPDSEAKPGAGSRQQQLLAALTSPFTSGAVHLRLTTLFSNTAKAGSYVTSLMHINCRDLKFVDGEDGWQVAKVDVVLITYRDNGQPVDQSDKTFTIRLRGDTYKRALENGLIYTIQHPIKKPGAYQLRAAVRDAGAGVVGAASQFIEVPDVSKGRLTMSGLFLKTPPLRAGTVAEGTAGQEGQQPVDDPLGNPALRIFKQGQQMIYAFQVINARQDGEKKTQIETQIRLFRDGQKLYEGKPMAFVPEAGPDPSHVLAGGQLRLSRTLAPGEYVLQVQVTDKLGKPKQNVASQWIDFQLEAGQ